MMLCSGSFLKKSSIYDLSLPREDFCDCDSFLFPLVLHRGSAAYSGLLTCGFWGMSSKSGGVFILKRDLADTVEHF
jgi:hypothetical protein